MAKCLWRRMPQLSLLGCKPTLHCIASRQTANLKTKVAPKSLCLHRSGGHLGPAPVCDRDGVVEI